MKHLLFVVGGRGVGKTTIGLQVAQRLGYRFCDTDEMVCGSVDQSITEIVEQRGWQEFRRIEREILEKCSLLDKTVVATGGGSVLHKNLWDNIKQHALVVWLTAPPGVCEKRVRADRGNNNRPSLTEFGALEEFALVDKERLPLYRRVADLTIDTATLDRACIVADIVSAISRT